MKKYISVAALSALGLTCVASAARDTRGAPNCAPQQPAVCYPEGDCPPCKRCLGPENFAGNPPVCPHGCDGDWVITAAAFYWSAHQDGMEYAIDNQVSQPAAAGAVAQTMNILTEAEYKHPTTHWDWGFKVGLGYCSPCDGWDVNLLWTWFQNTSKHDFDADNTNNHTILPLWSNFVPGQGGVLFAVDAAAHWKLKLNLVDLELGRNFWVSRYLAIRPFVGVRYASLRQRYDIHYSGGAWAANNITPAQSAFNGEADLENNYRGAGLRAGLNSEWNFGCGWALYGNLAAAIVYGRFKVDHDEFIRRVETPHTETNILETDESFRASRAMLDLALGIQWSTMFCDCQYSFTAMLGWEQHMFFDQNQMWRVVRVGSGQGGTLDAATPIPNNTGDNVFHQRRGSLDTQGWTLTLKFDF